MHSICSKLITKTPEVQPVISFPAYIYLLKVNNKNTKKGIKYVQS